MMISLVLFSALALNAAPVAPDGMQTDRRSPADAAQTFSLDLASPTAPATAPVPTVDAQGKPPANAVIPQTVEIAFTLDTPIAQLVADTQAKAVLDRDLPGLSDDPNLAKFQSSSLRGFQPMTGGQLTDAMLTKTAADLAAIGSPSGSGSPPMSASPRPAPNKKMDSGR